MRQFHVALMIVAGTAVTGLTPWIGVPLSAQQPRAAELVQEEQSWAEARSKGTVGSLLHSPFIVVDRSGMLHTAKLTSPPVRNVRLHPSPDVHAYTGGTVVTGTESHGDDGGDVRFIRVWVRDRRWRVAAMIETPVAQRPAEAKPFALRGDPPAYPSLDGAAGDVLRANRAAEDAYAANDRATYERLTAAEYVRVTGSGQVFSRDEWLRTRFASSSPATASRTVQWNDEFQVRVFGDLAVLVYRNVTVFDGQARSPARQFRVYVRRDGRWQSAFAQATPIQ